MSSDPINIADDAAAPLELVWYLGAPGPTNRSRLAITRGSSSVDMSVTELGRLVHTAGVVRFLPSPYGIPESYPSRVGADACSFCGKPADEHRAVVTGPGVNICEDCTELAGVMLTDERDPAPWRKPREHQVNQPSGPVQPNPFGRVEGGDD